VESRQTVNGDRSIINGQKTLQIFIDSKDWVAVAAATWYLRAAETNFFFPNCPSLRKLADAFDAGGVSAKIVEADAERAEKLTQQADVSR
jgi:hypothetical protein